MASMKNILKQMTVVLLLQMFPNRNHTELWIANIEYLITVSGRAIIKDLLTLMAPSGVSREAAYCNHYLSLSLSLSEPVNANFRSKPKHPTNTNCVIRWMSLFILSFQDSLQPPTFETVYTLSSLHSLLLSLHLHFGVFVQIHYQALQQNLNPPTERQRCSDSKPQACPRTQCSLMTSRAWGMLLQRY